MAASVEDSEAQLRQLAALAGILSGAKRWLRGLTLRWRRTGAGRLVSAVLWQPGGIVPGEGQLVEMRCCATRALPSPAARGMGQAEYLAGSLLADPPEILLVAGQERMQRHPTLCGTR
ncbi:MAG: hypothetical protein R3E18_00620 [Sphingomonadaceae bacterium]